MLDVIPVPLGLAGFRVTGVERVEKVEGVEGVERVVRVLEAGVEAVRGWSRCPWCGAGRRRVRGYRPLRVRSVPLGGWLVVLVWRRRRFGCGGCGRTHVETDPQVTGKFTLEYAGELARDTAKLSIAAVAEAADVGWGTIQRLVNTQGEGKARRRRALPCRVLGVDETSIGRGHKHYDGCSTTGIKATPWGCSPGGAKPSSDQVLQGPGPQMAQRRGGGRD